MDYAFGMERHQVDELRQRVNELLSRTRYGGVKSLADAAGVNRETIYRFSKGNNVSSDSLMQIAEALKAVDVEGADVRTAPPIDFDSVAKEAENVGRYMLSLADMLRSAALTTDAKRQAIATAARAVREALEYSGHPEQKP